MKSSTADGSSHSAFSCHISQTVSLHSCTDRSSGAGGGPTSSSRTTPATRTVANATNALARTFKLFFTPYSFLLKCFYLIKRLISALNLLFKAKTSHFLPDLHSYIIHPIVLKVKLPIGGFPFITGNNTPPSPSYCYGINRQFGFLRRKRTGSLCGALLTVTVTFISDSLLPTFSGSGEGLESFSFSSIKV